MPLTKAIMNAALRTFMKTVKEEKDAWTKQINTKEAEESGFPCPEESDFAMDNLEGFVFTQEMLMRKEYKSNNIPLEAMITASLSYACISTFLVKRLTSVFYDLVTRLRSEQGIQKALILTRRICANIAVNGIEDDFILHSDGGMSGAQLCIVQDMLQVVLGEVEISHPTLFVKLCDLPVASRADICVFLKTLNAGRSEAAKAKTPEAIIESTMVVLKKFVKDAIKHYEALKNFDATGGADPTSYAVANEIAVNLRSTYNTVMRNASRAKREREEAELWGEDPSAEGVPVTEHDTESSVAGVPVTEHDTESSDAGVPVTEHGTESDKEYGTEEELEEFLSAQNVEEADAADQRVNETSDRSPNPKRPRLDAAQNVD